MIAPNSSQLLGLQPGMAYAQTNPSALPATTTAVPVNPAVVPGVKTNQSAIPTLGAQPAPQYAANASVPPTGLIGSEQALLGGFAGAIDSLNSGSAEASNVLTASGNAISGSVNPAVTLGAGSIEPLQQASANFSGYMDAGTAAAKMQADLLGANGVQAQQAAIAQQQSNPATDYAMEQAIKARERSAAARGQLFSGNTGLELNRDLAGIFSQDAQQRFNNLGSVANQGLSAASQDAGLKSNEANLAANIQSQGIGNDAALLQQKNSIQANIADRIANIKNTTGENRASLFSQTGQQLGAGRAAAGTAIAQNVSNTANSISEALKQQGIGVSDSMSADITTISNLLHEYGMQDSADAKTLAQILANISGSQASNLQQGYQNVGDAQAAGVLGTNAAIQKGINTAIKLGVG
jgi:hypothetical protein